VPPSTALTPTSYVVLGLLATQGPSTPYEMEQLVDVSLGHFWSFPHSQLYGEPARLTERGLVAESREEGGRRRRTFTITDDGRRVLQDWLAAPGEPSGTEIRDLGLLRLFFGAAARAEDDVVANARVQAEGHRSRLALYRDLVDVVHEPHVAATLRLGTAYEGAAAAFWDALAGRPAVTGVRLRVELVVADLDATVDFYAGVLGFAVTKDDRSGTPPHVALERDHVHVGAVASSEPVAAEPRRTPTGVELVLEVDDLAAEVERISAAGWPVREGVTRGLVDVRLLDPDGHRLRVTGRAGDDGGLGR
jgi:DNA-binding PadR family transcriptional regulator/catechol 2,3-dioxygenase-like lactoylglutathione lyase family enzyme